VIVTLVYVHMYTPEDLSRDLKNLHNFSKISIKINTAFLNTQERVSIYYINVPLDPQHLNFPPKKPP
jgi:hypothetical protein